MTWNYNREEEIEETLEKQEHMKNQLDLQKISSTLENIQFFLLGKKRRSILEKGIS
jgi:hypothetical protein